MTSLNRLAIQGIRSFDDKSFSAVEFSSPVTVIVGPNGSGKTTVIECLKYATTGDQPPNARFVHDPKLANEEVVKAQVRLSFNAADGRHMLAVRNLSAGTTAVKRKSKSTPDSFLGALDEYGNIVQVRTSSASVHPTYSANGAAAAARRPPDKIG